MSFVTDLLLGRVAKAAEHPAEDQQLAKVSLGESVWYPSLMYRFESGLSYSGCVIDKESFLSSEGLQIYCK